MNTVTKLPRRAAPIAMPHGLRGRAVFAQAGIEPDFVTLSRTFGQYHAEVLRQGTAMDELREGVDKLGRKFDGLEMRHNQFVAGGDFGGSPGQPNQAYAMVGDFMRRGANSEMADFMQARRADPEFRAAMTTLSDPDGGYLVVPQLETGVKSIAQNVSPVRALSTVVTIGTGRYEIITDPNLAAVGWTDEQQPRPETTGPSLAKIGISTGELYANPKISQVLLEDSNIDLGAWLTNNIGLAMAQKEGTAFVSGDGIAGKPTGFLSGYTYESGDDFSRSKWNTMQYVAAGSSTPSNTQLADAIIAMSQKLRAPYRQNATWLMSRDTSRVLRQLKDNNNLYLWNSDYGRIAAGQPETLCSFPVQFSEDMPVASGANVMPIALGDFKQGYTVVDRVGLSVLRDPFSAKPFVSFYVRKRVGGGVTDFNAIKFLKYSAS